MAEDVAPFGLSVETTIRRDCHGRWFHDNEPVENPAVARAFDHWIDRADNGRFILRNTVNWAYVEIEGAPVFVRRLEVGERSTMLHLSDGRVEALAPETLRQGPDGRLYCRVRSGALVAEFTSPAMLDLLPYVDEDKRGLFLRLNQGEVRPSIISDPLV